MTKEEKKKSHRTKHTDGEEKKNVLFRFLFAYHVFDYIRQFQVVQIHQSKQNIDRERELKRVCKREREMEDSYYKFLFAYLSNCDMGSTFKQF